MLINLQPNRSSLDKRIKYLLEGTERKRRSPDCVEVIYGDVEVFKLIHQHSRKVKGYNLLITFKESKEELERKLSKRGITLKDLHDEILSYILPYNLEEVNIFSVAHSDTEHYHWHITIDNQNLITGKALYLPKTKLTIRLYDCLRRYISAKYGISLGIPQSYSVEVGTKKLIEKLKEKGKEGTTLKKEQIKSLITEQVRLLIVSGDINSRKDIEDYIEQVLGLEINRRGKSYISIRYGKAKIRLSGGIYDEQRFGQVAEKIRRGEDKDFYESPERVGELERELRALVERYRGLVKQRIQTNRRENESDRERESEGAPISFGREKEGLGGAPEKDNNRGGIGALFYRNTTPSNPFGYERLEIFPSTDVSDRGSVRSCSRLEDGENGRKNVLQEKDKGAFHDREEIRRNKARMDKEMENNNVYGREYRKRVSLSIFQNSFGKRERGVVHIARRKGVLHSSFPRVSKTHTLAQKMYRYAVELWEKRREEELEAIKNIPPEVIFEDLGIEYKVVSRRLCIYAPWRDEKKPSVYIERKENGHYVWKDFGSDEGGTWIDFFMKLNDWGYVETVKYLREHYLGVDTELAKEVERKSSFSFGSRKYEILQVKEEEVSHPVLKRYLRKRGITKIPEWLKELHYTLKDKETGEEKHYFALGVKTLSGSWILRNPLMKLNLTTKEGQEHTFAYISQGQRKLYITEGMFDALSLYQLKGKEDFDLIILGGVGNAKKLFNKGVLYLYDQIIVATDRDEAGEKFFKELLNYFISKRKNPPKVIRLTFEEKDLNEAIKKGKTVKTIDYTEQIKEAIKKELQQELELQRQKEKERQKEREPEPSPKFWGFSP